MRAELKDISYNTIASKSIGSESDLKTDITSNEWNQKTLLFNIYGTGVRYLVYTDGGQDTTGWSGYYGVAMDDTSVQIQKQIARNRPCMCGCDSSCSALLRWGFDRRQLQL